MANLSKSVARFEQDSADDLRQMGMALSSIVTLTLNLKPISELRQVASARNDEISRLLDVATPGGVANQAKAIADEVDGLRKKLDEPGQAYQKYLADLETWNRRKVDIIGDSEAIQSLTYLKEEKNRLSTAIPAALTKAVERHLDKLREIYQEIQKLVDIYRLFYEPVQRFIRDHEVAKKVQLNFHASIAEHGFAGGFPDQINQASRGSFYGASGTAFLQAILAQHDFLSADSCVLFLSSIVDSLTYDRRDGRFEPINVESQLKKG